MNKTNKEYLISIIQQKVNYKKNGKEYLIKVNCTQNVVTIYGKDEKGNYTIPVKAMICTTGDDTPKQGHYNSKWKYRWRRFTRTGVYVQYATVIEGRYLFHSVPYIEKSPDTLQSWRYNELGQTKSHGCIRLTVEDAKWLFDNCAMGTDIEFYCSENPGPLGKPKSIVFAPDEKDQNWDPTDPDPRNPWKNKLKNNKE